MGNAVMNITQLTISAISRTENPVSIALLGTLSSTKPFTIMVISALYSHSQMLSAPEL